MQMMVIINHLLQQQQALPQQLQVLIDTKPKSKNDRSKTLVYELRRKGRMRDKIYALRSLIPNITSLQ
jgi:hypothetical protein